VTDFNSSSAVPDRVSGTPQTPEPGLAETPVEPCGGVGLETVTCTCGAGPHPERPDRCANGHIGPGNQLAVLTGQHSAAFWAAEADARRDIRQAVIADAGHTEPDAPRTLAISAETLAQAVLVRDSAYLRLATEGGPMTASGRARRCFKVWCAAVDRLERHVRLVGLRRVPPAVPSPREYWQQKQQESRQA